MNLQLVAGAYCGFVASTPMYSTVPAAGGRGSCGVWMRWRSVVKSMPRLLACMDAVGDAGADTEVCGSGRDRKSVV